MSHDADNGHRGESPSVSHARWEDDPAGTVGKDPSQTEPLRTTIRKPKPFSPQSIRTATQLQADLKNMFPFLTRSEVAHASHIGAPFYLAPPIPSLNEHDQLDPRRHTHIPPGAERQVEDLCQAALGRTTLPPSVVATGVTNYAKLVPTDCETVTIARKLSNEKAAPAYPLPANIQLVTASGDRTLQKSEVGDGQNKDGSNSSSGSASSAADRTILNAEDILRLRARLPPGYRIVRVPQPPVEVSSASGAAKGLTASMPGLQISMDRKTAGSAATGANQDSSTSEKSAAEVALHVSRIMKLLSKRHREVAAKAKGIPGSDAVESTSHSDDDLNDDDNDNDDVNDVSSRPDPSLKRLSSRGTATGATQEGAPEADITALRPPHTPSTPGRATLSSRGLSTPSSERPMSPGLSTLGSPNGTSNTHVASSKSKSAIHFVAPSTVPSSSKHSTTRVRVPRENEPLFPDTGVEKSETFGIFEAPRKAGVGMSSGSIIPAGTLLPSPNQPAGKEDSHVSAGASSAKSSSAKSSSDTAARKGGAPKSESKSTSRSSAKLSSSNGEQAHGVSTLSSANSSPSDGASALPALGHQALGTIGSTPLRCGLFVQGNIWAAERAGSIVIRNVATGQLVGTLNTGDLVAALCYVPATPLVDTAATQAANAGSGSAAALAAVAGGASDKQAAEAAAQQLQQSLGTQVQTGFGTVAGFPFPTVWAGTKKGVILIYKAATRRLIKQMHIHVGCVTAIVRTPVCVISASLDFQINVWSLSGKYLKSLVGHTNGVRCLLPIGHGIPLSDFQRAQYVFSRVDDPSNQGSQGNQENPGSVATTSDGSLLDLNGTQFETLKLEATAEAAASMVYLYSGSDDGTLKLWDVRTGECLQSVNIGRGSVLSIITTGRTIWTATETGLITSWTLGSTLTPIRSADTPGLRIQHLLAMGPHVWSCGQDPRIYVWDAETMQFVTTLNGHTKFCNHLVKVDTVTVRTVWSLSMGDGAARIWRSITSDSPGNDTADALAALTSEYLTVRSHLKALLDNASGGNGGAGGASNLSQLQTAFQAEIDKVVYDLAITEIGKEELSDKLEVANRRIAELEAKNKELTATLEQTDSERASAQAHIKLLLDKVTLLERQREREYATYQNRLQPLERRLDEQTRAVDKSVRALAAELAKARAAKQAADIAQNTLLTAETRLALFADAAAWERDARQRTQKASLEQRDLLISLESEVKRLQSECNELRSELERERRRANELTQTLTAVEQQRETELHDHESRILAAKDLEQQLHGQLESLREQSMAASDRDRIALERERAKVRELGAQLQSQRKMLEQAQHDLKETKFRADELQRAFIALDQRLEIARQVAKGISHPTKLGTARQLTSKQQVTGTNISSSVASDAESAGHSDQSSAAKPSVLTSAGASLTLGSESSHAKVDPLAPTTVMSAVAEELRRCKDTIRTILSAQLSGVERLAAGIPLASSQRVDAGGIARPQSGRSAQAQGVSQVSDQFGFRSSWQEQHGDTP